MILRDDGRWYMSVSQEGYTVRINDNEEYGHETRVFDTEDEASAAYTNVVAALDRLATDLEAAGWKVHDDD